MQNKLFNTPFTLTVSGVTYYFKEEKTLKKFMSMRDEVLKETNDRLMRVYKGLFDIDLNIFSDIRLYHQIHKRGFLIKKDGILYNNLDEIKFVMNGLVKI